MVEHLKIETPEMSYIIGFLWADGYLKHNTVSVTLATKDFDNIYKIFSMTNDWKFTHRKKYLKKTNKYYDCSCISLSDKLLSKFLNENDFKNKSHVSPYKILSNIPQEFHKDFFRGYIDGDGSFVFTHNNGCSERCNFSITSTLEQDWSTIENFFNSIDIKHYKIYKYMRKCGNSSSINISNKWDIIKLGDYLYNESKNIRLERKYEKFNIIKNCDIEKDEPKWTENDNVFLVENYKLGVKYCANKLKRSKMSIYAQKHRLNITDHQHKWSKDEENFLQENYPSKGCEYCSKLLNIDLNKIKGKVIRMKLKLDYLIYSDDDIKFILENYKSKGVDYCAEKLNRSKKSISDKYYTIKNKLTHGI